MAEPAGLLIELPLAQSEVARALRTAVPDVGRGVVPVGHVLARMLRDGDLAGDVVILHHDAAADRLFLAVVLARYSEAALAPVWAVVSALADRMEPGIVAWGMVATTVPDVLESVCASRGVLRREPAVIVPEARQVALVARLWSFAGKGGFPDAATSMRKRDMQCKPFRAAWKGYLDWLDKEERPARIAAATAAAPYCLEKDILTWDGIVVQRDGHTGRDIVFPGADPLTFRKVTIFHADRRHVWERVLADGSPPQTVMQGGFRVNNRAAIWEYRVLEGAVGADFNWRDDRWDTLFWTDRRRIYALDDAQRLVALPEVAAAAFRPYGQCFGTDGAAVYHGARRLPLDVARMRTEGYFIWDDAHVNMAGNAIALCGKGFRIVEIFHRRGVTFYRLADDARSILIDWRAQEVGESAVD